MPKSQTRSSNYSGVNFLLLWDALFRVGYAVNQWVTFKQALAMGGAVRKRKRGTTVVFVDSFTR